MLVLVLVFLCAANTLSAGSLTVSNVTAAPDSGVTSNVTFAAQGDQLVSIQFDLRYDGNVVGSVSASAGAAASAAGKDVQTSSPAANTLRVLVFGLNQNVIGDGVVVTLTLGVRTGAAAGSYPLTVADPRGTDRTGRSVTLSATSGTLTVSGGGGGISISSVENGATFAREIGAAAWVAIKGANLASTTRIWGAADFQGNRLPTSLDGVSVLINNRPAYIYYISPTQVNVLAPAEDAEGTVTVELRSGGQSASATVQRNRFSPGFFMFDPEGRRYVAAVRLDGTYVGKPSLYPTLNMRAARPGEVISLYGTGCGPSNPPYPDGEIGSGSFPLANSVTLRFGATVVRPSFAGIVGPGLVQMNVTVPDLPDGDVLVTVEVGGRQSPSASYLTIQR